MPVHDDTGDDVIGAFGRSARVRRRRQCRRAFDDDDRAGVSMASRRCRGRCYLCRRSQPMLASDAMR
jgi:hypothetical protein